MTEGPVIFGDKINKFQRGSSIYILLWFSRSNQHLRKPRPTCKSYQPSCASVYMPPILFRQIKHSIFIAIISTRVCFGGKVRPVSKNFLANFEVNFACSSFPSYHASETDRDFTTYKASSHHYLIYFKIFLHVQRFFCLLSTKEWRREYIDINYKISRN